MLGTFTSVKCLKFVYTIDMRKVDIPKFRKEVVQIIEANRDKVTSFEHEEDYSIFTFCGDKYACEITLTDKWIGYDLGIETPEGMSGCGLVGDTDIYPIYGGKNEEIALEIYDDLLDTVKAIFDGRVYYSSNDKFSYTAKQDLNGKYSVNYWERKKLLFWPYSSGWANRIYTESEFKKLNLKVLS